MPAAVPVRVDDDSWSPALAGIQAPALDCLQANLAVLADRHHHRGAHLALGAPLRFALTGPESQPSLTPGVDRRLAEAGELLGLRVTARWDGLDGARLRDLATGHAPLYVVADAYFMAWVPYVGQRHLEHSFLLVQADPAGVTVVDAYHNETEWGQARPGAWRITAAGLDAAVAGGAVAVTLTAGPPPELDATAVLAQNARAAAAAAPDLERYVDRMRSAADDLAMIEQLVLDVWLLSRERTLHASWLAAQPGRSEPAALAGERAQAWQRFTLQTFLIARRARRGQAVPASVVEQLSEMLRSDVALTGRLARPGAAAAPASGAAAEAGPRAAVLLELAAITGMNGASVDVRAELRTLPGLNSVRVADLLGRVEARLGLQVDPGDLTLDSLRSVSSLCELFARAADRAAGTGR